METLYSRVSTVLKCCNFNCNFLRRTARPYDRMSAILRYCDLKWTTTRPHCLIARYCHLKWTTMRLYHHTARCCNFAQTSLRVYGHAASWLC